ncbi:hypothetical protein [Blastopirellula marina]|uniref:SPOR domain-containing protein n=1 Tax=Blastopirellula marina TaxID=124 RepID=A0A2S8GNP4_9BACT|nr:hypothetical protein [Blastopirellula marina]PQO46038.1 hypothetical protein C5Y93_10675 [Blastopirellula marina]
MDQSSYDEVGKWISVSAPGGMARQVIVDVFDATDHSWKRIGTFADRAMAEKQITNLQVPGSMSRIISQSFCATGR